MKVVEIGNLESLFSSTNDAAAFPYNKTYDEAEWEPICTLHSSGTTGMPKPIVVRHGAMGLRDGQQKMSRWRGQRHAFDILEEELERLFLPGKDSIDDATLHWITDEHYLQCPCFMPEPCIPSSVSTFSKASPASLASAPSFHRASFSRSVLRTWMSLVLPWLPSSWKPWLRTRSLWSN